METQDNLENNQNAKFENESVDPGFEPTGQQPLTGREDKRTHNIDANMSISEMRELADKDKGGKLEDQPAEDENGKEDDAMNYKSDREQGTYNSKRS